VTSFTGERLTYTTTDMHPTVYRAT